MQRDSFAAFRRELTAKRNRWLWGPAIVGAMVGCGAGLKPDSRPVALYGGRPYELTVMIDTAFNDLETWRIIQGLDSWVTGLSGRNLVIHTGRESNPDASSAPPGWVHVIRRGKTTDLAASDACERPQRLGCWRAGTRHIYIAADDLNLQELQSVSAHELGHAMGLGHCIASERPTCKLPSIMGEYLNQMCLEPTTDDFNEFCRLNGCEGRP